MPKPQNPERTETTIGGVPKSLVLRIRKYADKDPDRKGNESTATILGRIIDQYEKDHEAPNVAPQPTYPKPTDVAQ